MSFISRKPREIGTLRTDFSPPGNEQLMRTIDDVKQHFRDQREAEPPDDPPAVDMAALEKEMERKPLDEIAKLMRSLTYGEMMELSEQTGVAPDVFHKWSKGRG